MKALTKILAVCSTLVAATAAHAIVWTDIDVIAANLTQGNPTYSGSFNILNDGYNPATMQVTSAVAAFAFVDDAAVWNDDADEVVSISLDGSLWKSAEVDGFLIFFDWVAGNLTGSFLSSLQDGVLNYVVTLNANPTLRTSSTSSKADTWLLGAKLIATGERKGGGSHRVPDNGTTLGLLGVALCALALARRRVAA